MALPPQFMKNFKSKDKKDEKDKGNPFAKKHDKKDDKHHNAKTEAIKKLAKKGK